MSAGAFNPRSRTEKWSKPSLMPRRAAGSCDSGPASPERVVDTVAAAASVDTNARRDVMKRLVVRRRRDTCVMVGFVGREIKDGYADDQT